MFWSQDDGPVSDPGSRNREGQPPSRVGARRASLPRRQRPTPPECPESKRGRELDKIEPELEIEIETLSAS
jgi:hypothetical protein